MILIHFVTSPSQAGESSCRNTGQVQLGFDNTALWIGLQKKLALEAASKDFKGFCEWNRMDRATGYLLGSKEEGFDQGIKDYRKAKNEGDRKGASHGLLKAYAKRADAPPPQFGNPPPIVDTWEASLTGAAELKEYGNPSHFPIFFDCKGSSQTCGQTLLKALKRTDLKNDYSVPEYDLTDDSTVAYTAAGAGLCNYLVSADFSSCYAGASDMLTDMQTYAMEDNIDAKVTGVPLIKATITDPKITKALKNVAVQLWGKITKKSFGKSDNIFDDLNGELRKQGFSKLAAKKEAVLILGAIATGGPNFSYRVFNSQVSTFPKGCKEESCNLNAIYMQAIAEGMVHGDTEKMKSADPSPYSLPKGADFPCDSGKTYHFWEAAALADRLVDKGYKPDLAKAVTFAGDVGYQLMGRGDSAVLKRPRFGAVESGTMMDLNLAAAGASFGARIKDLTGSEPLPIRQGVLNEMQASNLDPARSNDFLFTSTVTDWAERAHPREVLSSYP
jgi:hypothetical protein